MNITKNYFDRYCFSSIYSCFRLISLVVLFMLNGFNSNVFFHDLKLATWSWRWWFGFLWEYKSSITNLCFPSHNQFQWPENLAKMLSSLPSPLSCVNFWQLFMNRCFLIQILNICDYLQLFASYSLERSYQMRSLFQLIKLLDITNYFILYIMNHCFTITMFNV
jgi:hypothetical protein